STQALITKAKFLFGQGRNDEALERAKAALGVDPNSVPALYLIGRIELAKHRNAEASEAFTHVLRLNPRAATAQIELSRLKLASGDVAGSAESSEQGGGAVPGAGRSGEEGCRHSPRWPPAPSALHPPLARGRRGRASRNRVESPR